MFVISTHSLFFYTWLHRKILGNRKLPELGGEAGNVSERKKKSV
jgi:hypothetical protein